MVLDRGIREVVMRGGVREREGMGREGSRESEVDREK